MKEHNYLSIEVMNLVLNYFDQRESVFRFIIAYTVDSDSTRRNR